MNHTTNLHLDEKVSIRAQDIGVRHPAILIRDTLISGAAIFIDDPKRRAAELRAVADHLDPDGSFEALLRYAKGNRP